jgi:hypothetical protein
MGTLTVLYDFFVCGAVLPGLFLQKNSIFSSCTLKRYPKKQNDPGFDTFFKTGGLLL